MTELNAQPSLGASDRATMMAADKTCEAGQKTKRRRDWEQLVLRQCESQWNTALLIYSCVGIKSNDGTGHVGKVVSRVVVNCVNQNRVRLMENQEAKG